MESCCCSRKEGGEGPDQLGQEVLTAHNVYRSRHATPALQWSREAAEAAERWAKRLANTGTLEHDHESRMGQNLFQKTVVGAVLEVRGQEVVDGWYGESSSYDYSRPSFSSSTGHFTQVVWADSTHIGVASAVRDNTVYVVANYIPAGNVVGPDNFLANVKTPV